MAMRRIEYTSVDFPRSNTKVSPGTRWENVRWSDYIRAAITVGWGGWLDLIGLTICKLFLEGFIEHRRLDEKAHAAAVGGQSELATPARGGLG